MTVVICIVGSSKLSEEQTVKARKIILDIIGNKIWWEKLPKKKHEDEVFISGGAKGVDFAVQDLCKQFDYPFVVFKPRLENWECYKERNWSMAYACDVLYRIVSKDSKTYGSGWTRDRAKEMGKPVEEIVI